jgi:hypothetical protein
MVEVRALEALDGQGQAAVGDVLGRVLEQAQGADHGPGHEDGQPDGQGQDDGQARPLEDGLAHGRRGRRRAGGEHVGGQAQLDLAQQVDLGVHGEEPLALVDAAQAPPLAGQHLVAHRLDPVHVGAGHGLGQALALGLAGHRRELGQPGLLGPDHGRVALELAGREAAGGQGGVEQRALERGRLLGPGQRDEGGQVGDQAAVVALGRDLGRDRDQLVDRVGVVGQRLLEADGHGLVDRPSLLAQAVEVALGADQPVLDAPAAAAGVQLAQVGAEAGQGLVHPHPLGDHRAVALAFVRAHVAGGQVPFLLELVHQPGEPDREAGHVPDPVGLDAVGDVGADAHGGQAGEGEDGQDQDGHELGPDGQVLDHGLTSPARSSGFSPTLHSTHASSGAKDGSCA